MTRTIEGTRWRAALAVAGVAGWLGATAALAATQPGGHVDDGQEEAIKALQLLGADVDGAEERCQTCHGVNIYTLNRWMQATQMAQWMCLEDDGGGDGDGDDGDGRGNDRPPRTPMTPRQRVDCLRTDPANPASPFTPRKLGLLAAGAHLSQFETLFRQAYPEAEWEARYREFKTQVQMPPRGQMALSQEGFDQVRRWTLNGMPFMERILGQPGDAPKECKPALAPELRAHLDRMKLEGWAARNRDAGLQMFGCAPGQEGASCLATFPEARDTAFGSGWAADFPEAKLRILRELGFATDYWMRSSPDGRFLANGYRGEGGDSGGGGDGRRPGGPDADEDYLGIISDLQSELASPPAHRDVKVRALFDPAFFPDQSGFMFQGSPQGAGFCSMSILTDPATTRISFDEPVCSQSGDVGLYQSVGSSLGGGDHLAASGQFESDSGVGHGQGDGQPSWMEKSYLQLVPIVNDGQRFKTLAGTETWTPWLGDWTLAPSNALVSARVAGVTEQNVPRQMGYKFLFVNRRLDGDGPRFELKEAATLCVKGGKGGFSYDERFYTVFHYVDADDWAELGYASAEDPAFKQLLEQGSANVYVMDLLTGTTRRVTRMGPGQLAMFPHFRADGWLYFMVYDQASGKRWAVASDAALRLAR